MLLATLWQRHTAGHWAEIKNEENECSQEQYIINIKKRVDVVFSPPLQIQTRDKKEQETANAQPSIC